MDSPHETLRRLRLSSHLRSLVREVRLSVEQFIQPLFVVENLSSPVPVPGITGTFRDNSESVLRQIESDLRAGVRHFLLFGVGETKRSSILEGAFTARQVESIRARFGADLFLWVDTCLCSLTTEGHCGVLSEDAQRVDNARSVSELVRLAHLYVQSGADGIAPSDMMDGRVAAIRRTLDDQGFARVPIMSYAAKFHSKFYGPFRVAADCAPQADQPLRDRASYQIDSGTPRDALACARRDLAEGADILMVKPGMPYLDQLARLSQALPERPWAVYQVSGEYAALEALAEKKLIQAADAHREIWTAFVRAGASIIITYGARYARSIFQESERS